MTSILGTQSIQHPNGTAAASINSSGVVTFSQPPVGVISEADMFRFTSNLINTGSNKMSGGFERVDDASFAKIGTGMTESSGVFTFPATGLYLIIISVHLYIPDSNDGATGVDIMVSQNGGVGFDQVATAWAGDNDGSGQWYGTHSAQAFVNVTDVSNVKVQFNANSSSDSYIVGDTNVNQTSFSFIRLGASQ
tara:strand:+ start:143 stop:721 length:579 start_codon:yes stop_codon:yes gene_type:complete